MSRRNKRDIIRIPFRHRINNTNKEICDVSKLCEAETDTWADVPRN